MATTVDLKEITEFFDTSSQLSAKVSQLAEYVRASKHMTTFTGAGISTSAGINDYRGPNGVWTCRAKGVKAGKSISLEQAQPTSCHKFLVDLVKDGTLKYVVSQNVDGLHRRSGIPRENLSELHGNSFLEQCWKCGDDYEQTFKVTEHRGSNVRCADCKSRTPHFCHCTKRRCTSCRSQLKDSVIHFGESLPTEALERAFANAHASDLCVVLGSSLRVSPACDIPLETKKKGGKLVIVNLQTTPLDKYADIRIWARIDEVCALLEAALRGEDISAPIAATSTEVEESATLPQSLAPSARPAEVPKQRSRGVALPPVSGAKPAARKPSVGAGRR